MHEKIIERAAEIIESMGPEGYCVLSLIDLDGYPTSSTVSPAKASGIEWVTFCGGFGLRAQRIEKCNRASLCFNAPNYNISLVGTMEILTDPSIKKEMWYEGLEHHFSGPEDEGYAVLRFTTERYNLFIDYESAQGVL